MNTKIGVFDSGIGGITVLKECIKKCPNFSYIYYSDSKNNPYGEKSESELISIVDNIVTKLIDRGCKIIIIACNTASGVCVSYLRDKYKNIIFIAIEPAIKVSYDKDIEGTTLVMATKATLNSAKFSNLYSRFKDSKKYCLLECNGLAHLIEINDKKRVQEYLEKNLSKYRNKVDSVVLGCTHYPLIKKEITSILGNIKFYDGSEGLSNRLKDVIEKNKFNKETFNIEFIDSNNDLEKRKRFFELLN